MFRSKIKNPELDLTPMIDVVFLLIVFLTLIINFAAADQDERIKLPVSELAQPPEMPPTTPLVLHILPNGNVIFDGNEYTLERLHVVVDHQLRVIKFSNIPIEQVTVILRADARCQAGQVLDTIEWCQAKNLEYYILRTQPPILP